jgi:endonuclease/exonuclease/phosphatase family metal-dependent hydrolase
MKMKSFLCVVLSLVVLNSFAQTFSDKGSNSKSVKVMSYNIRIASPPSKGYGFTDLQAIAAVINNEKPDLIALQEVDSCTVRSGKNSFQAKDLAEMTGMYYHFAKALVRSEGDYGVAILSKYPILKSESYRLPATEGSESETRALAVVTVNVLHKKLVFMSVHLDNRTNKDRQFQSEKLLKIAKQYDQYPIILCGDFNMQANNDIFKLISQQFFMCCENQPFTIPSTNPRRTIDFILMNKKAAGLFSIVNYNTVDERYASDHLPVKMEIMKK